MLEDYANTFAFLGSISSIPFFILPLLGSWTIIKCGFSDFFPPESFIDGLFRTILFYQHAKLLGWEGMVRDNLFGITLSTVYLLVYYYYLWDKKKFYEMFFKYGVTTGLILWYANWQTSSEASKHVEYIVTLLNLCSNIYPLLGIIHTYKTKNTFGIPYSIVFAGQVVCTFWLLFAISVHNYLLMVQLLISFILGAIQITFYFIYPSTAPPLPDHIQNQVENKKTQ